MSSVVIDNAFHTFRLEWDGLSILRYLLDGALICTMAHTTQPVLDASDEQTFRLYAENYPGEIAKVFEVRRFAVQVG